MKGSSLGVLPALVGCTTAPGDAGAWGFVSLALVLAAGTAYALGRATARRSAESELRAARAELRQQQQLQDAWWWQTDAEHRLVTWQGPGRGDSTACTLFDPADNRLAERLQARRPFGALRLHSAQAQDGSQGWTLSGVPRHDELGRFSGFVGHAQPTDAQIDEKVTAAALLPSLAAHPTPALVALDAGEGWRVLCFNALAETLWPALKPGLALVEALPAAPGALSDAWEGLQPGAVAQVQGWRLAGFEPATGGVRGLLLTHDALPPAAEPSAEADTFSFTVSHDLRAPIRVVEGFTRIVKEDYGRLLDRVGNDHLDRVLGAAARMNLMIDALLTLARLSSQPLASQPVNLSQLAHYVVDDLRRGAPEREADIDIEPGLTTVGDPTLLRIVLENLLGNAWKYSGRSARTQISLRKVPHGAGTAYVVRDNGAGFDMRSSDRLFGLFQRLHSASEFPGHGVGLASVRRIVRRHGGEIWAEAEPGHGAAFFFTLRG